MSGWWWERCPPAERPAARGQDVVTVATLRGLVSQVLPDRTLQPCVRAGPGIVGDGLLEPASVWAFLAAAGVVMM